MSRRFAFHTSEPRKRGLRRTLLSLLRSLIAGVTMLLALLVGLDIWVSWSASDRITDRLEELPEAGTVVVLGTSKYYSNGINPYYQARLDSAVRLFEAGKAQRILASGDNLTRWYNEPAMITDDLAARGIPETAIDQDGEGSRTLYSVRRLRSEYDLEQVIIISQSFHLARALYQARAAGLDAWGYAADTPDFNWFWRVRLREIIARAAAVMEVALLGRAATPPTGDAPG